MKNFVVVFLALMVSSGRGGGGHVPPGPPWVWHWRWRVLVKIKVSELVKGRASCHKTLLKIYKWQSYSKLKIKQMLVSREWSGLPGKQPY